MMVSFAVQKLWSLIRSHVSILAFIAIAFGVLVMKFLPMPMSWMVLPTFSSSVFMVLCFMFKSLIYLELILVFEVTARNPVSAFCTLLVSFPTPFFKHGVLSALLVFAGFVKDQMVGDMWCLFWSLCSVPLVCISVLVLVPCCFDYCSLVE